MRKGNWVFLSECVVIVVLLFVIGGLLITDKSYAWGKEAEQEEGLVEEEAADLNIQEEGITQYAGELLGEQSEATVSGDNGLSISANSVSENAIFSNTISENTISGNEAEAEGNEEEETIIAVFGDSIWDSARGQDGISEQLAQMLGARVYNCAIGGSAAAVVKESTNVLEGWSSWSLNGLMYAAKGEVSPDSFLTQTPAYEPIKAVDFNEVDYLVIAYGLNDFFSRVQIYPEDMYDMNTYVGALRHGVVKMQEAYPEMKIILIGPTYCEAYADPNVDSLEMYAEAAAMVADEYDTYFMDMYHNMGINGENMDQYLEDGIHLNAEGRKIYAEDVAQLILSIEAER